ncbi:family 43 glycosylhydrolase [Pedobacter mucosus]|uniref:family 43 glycosylhydrolase n=1 Tax=Pedobacter mucosus TaxID=2895286 RepID=UPI001EE4039C|nr:family 43 glycosylhydrolase [Pedobacter mucosus]UKT64232.1 family 43 glycosylhydrolase [Pedobacter mucosus]
MSLNKALRFYLSLFLLIFFTYFNSFSQQPGNTKAIYSGLPWYDQNGKTVSAHGANIIKDKDKFYLFGEAHSDTSNAFVGFNCYSSKDLYNWSFESIALPVHQAGKLGPNRVGERVKVMKNPTSGEYFMYMHVDTLGYKDQFVGYATAKNITGPYQFKGPILFNGKPIKKWDMGTFQDKDGSGYILTHGGAIYQLAADYKSIIAETNKSMTSGFESPTLFKKENTYYFIGSNLTSWEKNDNYYYTATSLSGPWAERGLLAPKDKLTWNSQSTFVLAIEGSKDTTFMFMGDRWSYPLQLSAATYVWQPISFTGNSISIPKYHEAWTINTQTGAYSIAKAQYKVVENTDKKIQYKGNWKHLNDSISISRSATTNDSFSCTFTGKQIGLYALCGIDNGYSSITLYNKKGKILIKNMVDIYTKFPTSTLVFLSPLLPKDEYTLKVSVSGLRPNWSDKRKANYGSTANYVSFDKLIVKE